MFILIGTSTRESITGKGVFHCNYCRGEENYTLLEARSWFTFFFIPVFPISGGREAVYCHGCRDRYKPKVLDNRPLADDRELDAIYDELKSGLAVEKMRDRLVEQGEHPEDAAKLVEDAAGKGRKRCKACGLTYIPRVSRC